MKDVESLPVGDGRIGSEAAGDMATLVRPFFAQALHPRDASIPAVDGQSDKLMAVSDGHAVVNAGGVVKDGLLRLSDG